MSPGYDHAGPQGPRYDERAGSVMFEQIGNPYEDVGHCDRCGKGVNLQADPPCPHGVCACDTCGWGAVCIDCRRDAEREMFETGVYSRAADPLIDHLAPPAIDRIERDGGYWWEGHFVTVPRRGDADLARLLDVDGAIADLNEQAEKERGA